MTAAEAFALASVLHAGFQLTVTTMVYPALADRPENDWAAVHRRHSRRVTPLVGVVYLALAVSGVALVMHHPSLTSWLALAGAGSAVAVTAAGAAPLHGRLLEHDDAYLHRLLVIDRYRCAAAVAGAVAGCVSIVLT